LKLRKIKQNIEFPQVVGRFVEGFAGFSKHSLFHVSLKVKVIKICSLFAELEGHKCKLL